MPQLAFGIGQSAIPALLDAAPHADRPPTRLTDFDSASADPGVLALPPRAWAREPLGQNRTTRSMRSDPHRHSAAHVDTHQPVIADGSTDGWAAGRRAVSIACIDVLHRRNASVLARHAVRCSEESCLRRALTGRMREQLDTSARRRTANTSSLRDGIPQVRGGKDNFIGRS